MASQNMKDVMNSACEQAGVGAEDLEEIDFRLKLVTKLDADVLTKLTNITRIKLSTNCIEKMIPFPELKKLATLSLGRNQIKQITGLENIGGNLKNLWLSYNNISVLNGLDCCVKLEQLYLSNNKITSMDEIAKLSSLPQLNDLLLVGNPIYAKDDKTTVQLQVLDAVPQLDGNGGKVDGVSVAIIQSGGCGEDA